MQDNVTQARADWEFLRDTVTPPPFYHNEHAWSVMLSLIEKRLASTAQPEVKGLVEAVERTGRTLRQLEQSFNWRAGEDQCGNFDSDGWKAKADECREAAAECSQALAAYREAQL